MGLVRYGHGMIHNRPGTQWDWYTSMVWYTMGLVHNRPGTQAAGPTVFHLPGSSEGLGSVMKTKAISQPDLVLATCVPMH